MSQCPSVEVWKSVPGYEGIYEISNKGRLKRLCRIAERIMHPSKIRGGYFSATLSRDWDKQKCQKQFVHRLVLEAFNGPIPRTMWSDHLDGNKAHNCLHNLEVVTPAENLKRALEQGLRIQARGEQMWTSKLKERDVRRIRRLKGTISGNKLCKQYGVHDSIIYGIWNGTGWKHIH